MAMLYLYFLVTFTDGTKVLEPKGAAGPEWSDCTTYNSYLRYQKQFDYPRAKPVEKIDSFCMRGMP